MKRLFLSFMLSGAMIIFYSCDTKKTTETESEDTTAMAEEETMEEEKVAEASISSASGSNVSGTATFTGENGSVKFELQVENLQAGSHAVHIHENGDCSASDASSAGGHWNPTNVDHGERGNPPFHKGDIGNMDVGDDGKGTMNMTIEGWSVGGPDSTNVVGKAVIIHAGADDFTSQPSGAAGDRVACGAIEMK